MGQTRAGAHVTLFAGWGERSALLASECAHIAAQQERANPRQKDCADQTPAKRVNMMQYTLIWVQELKIKSRVKNDIMI